MNSFVRLAGSLFGLRCIVRTPMSAIAILSILSAILVQGTAVEAAGHDHHTLTRGIEQEVHTNSCMVAWASTPSTTSSNAVLRHVSNMWMVDPSVAHYHSGQGDDLFELDGKEFERYLEAFRNNEIQQAINVAKCVMNDFPELDLAWCLADWHDGKLVVESQVNLGETCVWNCPNFGWALDPQFKTLTDTDTTTEPFSWLSPRTWNDYHRLWSSGLAPSSLMLLCLMMATVGLREDTNEAVVEEDETSGI